ncbi:hypothetical protein GCM10017771_38190 [Streptomyces capitiformicae]|uniref:Uncharacterized protein n=1 Tax=Streptomyces capitiformicae TaxID=2014920 RepID=A0A919GR43_9ACTN|nr:hypothetical protein GCM10017771_38190 [Streptomyces capitiformicae]
MACPTSCPTEWWPLCPPGPERTDGADGTDGAGLVWVVPVTVSRLLTYRDTSGTPPAPRYPCGDGPAPRSPTLAG